jgi:hypothetical protein
VLEFIELPIFTQHIYRYLDDDEYQELQAYLTARPDAGAIVAGTGGVRKVRWGLEGRGKRSGARIIYYWRSSAGQIWMLTIYAKNETRTIPPHVLRRLRQEIDHE